MVVKTFEETNVEGLTSKMQEKKNVGIPGKVGKRKPKKEDA